MVVVSVAGLPHGMHQRSERLILAIEARDEPGETRERAIGLAVGCALLEVDADFLAGGLAALELHIDELGHRRAAINLGKTAVAENGSLQRELRRQSGAHLFFGAHLAGLVIDDDVAAVEQSIDAVGARGHQNARASGKSSSGLNRSAHSRSNSASASGGNDSAKRCVKSPIAL